MCLCVWGGGLWDLRCTHVQHCNGTELCCAPPTCVVNAKQRSSQRKCTEHLSNLPSHRDNATYKGIFMRKPDYEEKCMECIMQY